MTKEQNLELIRDKCVAANSKLGVAEAVVQCGKRGGLNIVSRSRPIRLCDVLLAIGGGKTYYGVMDDGKVIHLSPRADSNAKYVLVDARWNFREDDLTKQSEETLVFLAELLK